MSINVGTTYKPSSTNSKPRLVLGTFGTEVMYAVKGLGWDWRYETCSKRTFKRWAGDVTSNNEKASGMVEVYSFIENCRTIVREQGVDFQSADRACLHDSFGLDIDNCLFYRDETISIAMDVQTGRINIRRLPVNNPEKPHLKASNPVIHVDAQGKTYRAHGEWRYLIDHVTTLTGN